MIEKYNKKINEEIQNEIKSYISAKENDLSEFASKSEDGLRRQQKYPEDIRAKYSRDADRIIHTHAYSRYIDKTQVFFLVNNDHITHRVLHVQLVSKIARTIGRALKMNEDLIDAISLGHDIGHVPFGHSGEEILSDLCKSQGRFLHNVQSVQFLDKIEDCDLTLQVLDGILCHNGEVHNQLLKPQGNKSWEDFDREIEEINNGNKNYIPMTLEGCIVRFADTIAYLGRDIQDAKEIGLIDENYSEIPHNCKEKIGVQNDQIINSLIIDLIENSYGKDYISYSKEISDSVEEYKNFNYDTIYKNPKISLEKEKIKKMYEIMYCQFLEDSKNHNVKSKIFEHFYNLEWINKNYLLNSSPEEHVRDYIAGMTDRYFESVFTEIIFPNKVKTYKEGFCYYCGINYSLNE